MCATFLLHRMQSAFHLCESWIGGRHMVFCASHLMADDDGDKTKEPCDPWSDACMMVKFEACMMVEFEDTS